MANKPIDHAGATAKAIAELQQTFKQDLQDQLSRLASSLAPLHATDRAKVLAQTEMDIGAGGKARLDIKSGVPVITITENGGKPEDYSDAGAIAMALGGYENLPHLNFMFVYMQRALQGVLKRLQSKAPSDYVFTTGPVHTGPVHEDRNGIGYSGSSKRYPAEGP